MGYAYIGIIMVCRVVQNLCSKNISMVLPVSLRGRLDYLTFSKGVSAAFALALLIFAGSFDSLDSLSVMLASISGLVLALNTIFSSVAMQSGTVALCSMFSTAGLIIPCIAGALFFNESMSVWQWCGVAVFFFAAYLLVSSSKSAKPAFSLKTMLLLCIVLLLNGATMLCQKLFTFFSPDASVSVFSLFTFLVPAALCGLAVSAARLAPARSLMNGCEVLSGKLFFFGAIGAAALFFVNQLATEATKLVPSAVLFTFINGGNTLIAAIIGAAVFKEKLGVKGVAGIIIGIASLIIIKAL